MHSTAMEKFYIPTKVCFAAVSACNRFYNACSGFSTKKIAFLSIEAVCVRNRIFCELLRLKQKSHPIVTDGFFCYRLGLTHNCSDNCSGEQTGQSTANQRFDPVF